MEVPYLLSTRLHSASASEIKFNRWVDTKMAIWCQKKFFLKNGTLILLFG